jgi:hypothetical protein
VRFLDRLIFLGFKSPEGGDKKMKTPETIKRYIYCRNEGKIEEILKYLFQQEIAFEIVGRQALFLSTRDEEKLSNFLGIPWFEVEAKDNLREFPSECWQFGGRGLRLPFIRTVPDTFSPVQLPKQEKKVEV